MALTRTGSLVRTSSRNAFLLFVRALARSRLLQIGQELDLTPAARDGVEDEPIGDRQEREQHQPGRQDRGREARHQAGLDEGDEDRDGETNRQGSKRNPDGGEERERPLGAREPYD